MTAAIIAACCGISIALTAGWARMKRSQPTPPPPRRRCEWTNQAAVNAEFRFLLPDLVTKDVFALDAEMNRKARGAL